MYLSDETVIIRRARWLAVIAASVLCTASCVPLPLRYYVPSAEGAQVQSMSCAGGPPYGASLNSTSPRYHLLVSLEGSLLIVLINAESGTTIELDPSLMRVEEGGLPISIESARYRKTVYGSEPARDAPIPIAVNTGHLQVDVPLKLKGKAEVDVHLSPIIVNGVTTSFPGISFRMKRQVHLAMIMGNC
jgi:hypothetical protein